MFGPNEYNWSVLEEALAGAEAKNMHVVLRVFLHYPDQPLRVPSYLMDKIELRTISSGETSPQYDDPTLLTALEQFIGELGAKYDGHKSLAFIQLGLLGKVGLLFHPLASFPNQFPDQFLSYSFCLISNNSVGRVAYVPG